MNLSVVNFTDMCERKSQTKKCAVLFLYHFKVAELFCTVRSQNPTWPGVVETGMGLPRHFIWLFNVGDGFISQCPLL